MKSIKFKNNNLNIEKKLGSGSFGTTYLVKDDNNNISALKIQKIPKDDIEMDLRKDLWREIYFYNNFINNLNENDKSFFMKMYDFDFDDNCKHKQKFNRKLDPKNEFDKKIIEMNKSNNCILFNLEYKNGISLESFLNNYFEKNQIISQKLMINLLLQFIKAELLMKEKGYIHSDESTNNIMITNKNETIKHFKINNKNIKYNNYQLSMIDYGMVNNKKFPQTESDTSLLLFLNKPEIYHYVIIIFFLTYCSSNYNFLKYYYEKNNLKMPWEEHDAYSIKISKIIKNHNKFFLSKLEQYGVKYLRKYKYHILKLNDIILNSKTYIDVFNKLNDYDIFKYNDDYEIEYCFLLLGKIILDFEITETKKSINYGKIKTTSKISNLLSTKMLLPKKLLLNILNTTTVNEIIDILIENQ